jgi:hypothetical protein
MRTFIDVWLLLIKDLRSPLIRMRLYTQRFLYAEDLQQEWEITLFRAFVFEFVHDRCTDEVGMRG